MAATAEGASVNTGRSWQSNSLTLIRALIVNGSIVGLALAVYYFGVLTQQRQYQSDRAFRALGEVGTRIDNTLGTIESLFQSVPSNLRQNTQPVNLDLAIRGLQREVSKDPQTECNKKLEPTRFELLSEKSGFKVLAKGCVTQRSSRHSPINPELGTRVDFGLPVARLIDPGDPLDDFEQVALVDEKGEVLGLAGDRYAPRSPATVHEEILDPQELSGLRDLLIEAQRARWQHPRYGAATGEADKGADAGQLAQPPGAQVSLRTTLGGRDYRAYLMPYQPQVALLLPLATATGTAGGADAGKDKSSAPLQLYLVGFKRESLLASASADLGSEFNWYLLLLSIAGFALVPLVSLMLLPSHDAISPAHERLVLLSWLLLPALLVLGALSVLAGRSLSDLADSGARRYAVDLDQALRGKLEQVLQTLDHFAPLYRDPTSLSEQQIGYRLSGCDDSEDLWGMPRQYLRLLPLAATAVAAPPLPAVKNVLKVDGDGTIRRTALTWFDCVYLPQASSDVRVRGYWSALNAGAGWLRPDARVGANAGSEQTYVAQRLFNRLRGDKLLQLAVPWFEDGKTHEQGVLTADSAMFAFTAPVHPLGYSYAIFDEANGTVVFHSNDRRSLVENFYTESERSPLLMRAIRARQSGFFDLSYRGRGHRAYYQPLAYAPWGLAVLYPDEQVGGTVMRTGLTTLATYLAALLACALSAAVLLAPGLRHLAWSWPQWRLRRAYPLFLLLLGVSLVGQVAMFLSVDGGALAIGLLLSTLSLMGSGSALLRPADERRRIQPYRFGLTLLCDFGLCLVALQASGLGQALGLLAWVMHGWLVWQAWRKIRNDLPVNGVDPWTVDARAVLPLPERWQPESVFATKALYGLCISLLAAQLYAVPMAGFFLRSLDLQYEANVRAGLVRSAQDFRQRIDSIQQDLVRYVQDPNERRTAYADARTAALREPAPGFLKIGEAWTLSLWPELAPQKNSAPWSDGFRGLVPMIWKGLARVDPGLGYLSRLIGSDPLDPWHFEREGAYLFLVEKLGADQPGHPLFSALLPRPLDAHLFTRPFCTDRSKACTPPLEWTGLLLGLLLLVATVYSALLYLISHRLLGSNLLRPPLRPAQLAMPELREPPGHVMLVGLSEGTARRAALFHALYPQCELRRDLDLARDPLAGIAFEPGHWLLGSFDLAVLDSERRLPVLELIERGLRCEGAKLYLTAMTDPLFRLSTPGAYPGESAPLAERELARWCEALGAFRKRADLELSDSSSSALPLEAKQLDILRRDIAAECPLPWPRVSAWRDELLAMLDRGAIRSTSDVRRILLTHARAHFQRTWLSCSTHERLALYHLAHGRYINPRETRIIDLLLSKNLIAMRPHPVLMTATLGRFVVDAEPPETFQRWSEQASQGTWKKLRVPLFVVLLLIGVWAASSAGDTLEAATAVLSGTLAFFALVGRAAGLARGGPGEAK